MKGRQTFPIITFTTKGRVVIPAGLRRKLAIKAGTRAAVISTPEGILLQPVTKDYIRSLRGSLQNKKVWNAFQADRRRERRSNL